jgi:hypothetical protein
VIPLAADRLQESFLKSKNRVELSVGRSGIKIVVESTLTLNW